MKMDRRGLLVMGSALMLGATAAARSGPLKQRSLARVILDNDFAGDPDGLFQLAHHVLCGSVEIPLIIGSHLPAAFSSGHDASDSAERARQVLAVMGLAETHRPMAGCEHPIRSRQSWEPSAAAQAIVREAMRADTDVPLVHACGAGLTDLALAWLAEPRIGRRIRLIWIGGNPHPGLTEPGGDAAGPEFNVSIDPIAAQIIFNESDIEIWQVPSDAYRKMLFSVGELEELATVGALGAHLKAAVDAVPAMLARIPGLTPPPRSDAYVLGDSPLVTLSALLTPFAPDPASSRYQPVPTPLLNLDGSYRANPRGRPMRVYSDIDAGLTFRDMLARFRMLAARQAQHLAGG